MTNNLIDEISLDAELEAQMWAEVAKYERIVFWQFVRILLWGKRSKGKGEENALNDAEQPKWKYWVLYRWLCLLAILFGRSWRKRDKSYDYVLIAWANHHGDGYGWACDTISYNPKTFRYEIGRDGDSTY